MESIIYSLSEQQELLAGRFKEHKHIFNRDILNGVLSIFDEVALTGDDAIRSLTKKFDDVELNSIVLPDEFVEKRVSIRFHLLYVQQLKKQLIMFKMQTKQCCLHHEKQIRPGTIIGEQVSPLETVGIWIPARKGPLISTSIMLVVAAKVAGLKKSLLECHR